MHGMIILTQTKALGDTTQYRATCLCGWIAPNNPPWTWHDNPEEAVTTWKWHDNQVAK